MPSFAMREREEEGMPKRGTLSGFLHEYESQTQKFRDHITFPKFCKIKVRRSKQHNVGIFLLSNFDGSPTCSARNWVEELDTFLQQHQIFEDEAIRVEVLHFGGKIYAWCLFESFTLKNANTSSYASFIKTLVEIFGRKNSKTHVEKTNKLKQTKPLHVMEKTINSDSLQKTMEETNILHHTLL